MLTECCGEGEDDGDEVAEPQRSVLANMPATMVLILDGNSDHIAHARRKIGLFGFKKFDLLLLLIYSNV